MPSVGSLSPVSRALLPTFPLSQFKLPPDCVEVTDLHACMYACAYVDAMDGK